MSEFLSAVKGKTKEGKDRWYFLTHHLIWETPRGEMLRKQFADAKDGDFIGHHAIRAYFQLDGGENWECTDFSTPANFPDVIAEAIKRGEFRGLGMPDKLLTANAYKAWQEATAPADKAWQEATAPAYKAWQEATAPADKAWQEARANGDKAWGEANANAFWDLFANPENRAEGWR